MKERNTEFQKFDATIEKLLTVPHSRIKAKLDAEKAAKEKKRKTKESFASDRASGEKD